ncbi:MAG: M15 family metallopeptidase [Bacteroidota bacterium]
MIRLLIAGMLLASVYFSCGQPAAVGETSGADEAEKSAKTETPIVVKNEPVALDTTYTIDYIMGKFDPKSHPDFVLIETRYADRAGLYLHREVYDAFRQMYAAAKEAGITLIIRSATRNFNYQKGIWERKWTGRTPVDGQNLAKAVPDPKMRALKILEYSSMPGTSRHHWGTDIDFNSFDNSYFEQGEGKKIYDWLVKNAPTFGFCQTYTPKGEARPYGYNEEKWHWSYLPIAQQLTALAQQHLKDEMIKGFQGAATAVEIGVVDKYVLGINGDCLK